MSDTEPGAGLRPAPVVQGEPDSTTTAAERLQRVERRLAEVQAALGRLEDGTYGRCAACGADLTDGLLAADPTAALCPDCQSAAAPPEAEAVDLPGAAPLG